MSMSKNEKDEFIRKALREDKNIASGQELNSKIKRDIDISKIKLRKHTFGERRFIKFLGVLLVVSVTSNAYLIKTRKDTAYIAPEEPAKIIAVEDMIDDDFKKDIESTKETNTLTENLISTNVVENTTTPELVVEEAVTNHKELDEELLIEELTRYAITIGRLTDDNTNLAKNTIMLLVANNYFNSQVAQNTGLNISSNNKYATTAENVHLFLKEIAGIEVETFLDSYVNYIKYNEGSKFYASGPKSASLNGEKYEISNLKILSTLNGEYRLKGDIKKNSTIEVQNKNKIEKQDIEANYTFEAVVSINKNYTYVPYLIKSFEAKIKDDEQDTIVKVTDQEETENQR